MADTARCILGAKADSLEDIRLPCIGSFKLDGIRARWWHLEFMSRTFKTLPSRTLRTLMQPWLEQATGWDGEIIVGDPTHPDAFRKTESFVNSRNKPIPAEGVRFFVFDNSIAPGGFVDRLETIHDRPPFVVKLNQVILSTYDELVAFEDYAVARGYEGIVCRAPGGPYKHGRSTLREQYLVKVKRFLDDECTVIGFEELQRNFNDPELDERGYTKRSSAQDGKVPGGTLGKLVVRWGDRELRVGSGFTQADRAEIWSNRDKYLNRLARIRYLPHGMKDLPRHPIWKGWRTLGT